MARKKDIENSINGFLKELESNQVPITKAILFGSIAKGTSHKYSDIDLAIWSPAFGQNYHENITKTLSAKRKYLNIEVHPFPEHEDNTVNPFIDEIEKTGIPITQDDIQIKSGFVFPPLY